MAGNALRPCNLVVLLLALALFGSCGPRDTERADPRVDGELSLPLARLFPELREPAILTADDIRASIPRTAPGSPAYGSTVTVDLDSDGTMDRALVMRDGRSLLGAGPCFVGFIGFGETGPYRRQIIALPGPSCPGLRLHEDRYREYPVILATYGPAPDDCDLLFWSGSTFVIRPCASSDDIEDNDSEDRED